MERVVVTGVGVISPLALNAADHFRRWLAGDSAVTVVHDPLFEAYHRQLQAAITGYDRRQHISNRMLRKLLSPSAGYSVGAAAEALHMAGLADDQAVLEKCGLYVGSLSLEIAPEVFLPPLRASLDKDGEFDMSLFALRGMKLIDPLFMVKALPNAGVCGISVEHQVLGPNTNLTNGTTSGLMAVGLAAAAIQRGVTDCALAAGYDTQLGMDNYVENFIAGRLSERYDDPQGACRPFDLERDGFALGEGAACVVLESATHAEQRGAEVWGEILGLGQTTDVSLRPQGEGNVASKALEQAALGALQAGGCAPSELGVIYVDGLGTREDDLREARALEALTDGASIPVTASTPAFGYTGAASGVFSLIHALLALKEQVVPPLVNCHRPDPACPVHFVSQATAQDYKWAMVWNSDRLAKNVAVLVGR